MTTWSQLLDDYEATILAVEALVASGQEPIGEAWLPPMDLPTAAPSRDEWQRFSRLHERAAVCDAQLRQAMAEAGDQLDATRRTSVAARAYGHAHDLSAVGQVRGG